MVKKKKTTKRKVKKTVKPVKCIGLKNHCSSGCGYFIGFLGAAIYYISTATGFWNGVWGVIKALVWPAFLVFEIMKYFGM